MEKQLGIVVLSDLSLIFDDSRTILITTLIDLQSFYAPGQFRPRNAFSFEMVTRFDYISFLPRNTGGVLRKEF
jgi:hypothetical protein